MPNYERMYSILCKVASEAIDDLQDANGVEQAKNRLQEALWEAEEEYLES